MNQPPPQYSEYTTQSSQHQAGSQQNNQAQGAASSYYSGQQTQPAQYQSVTQQTTQPALQQTVPSYSSQYQTSSGYPSDKPQQYVQEQKYEQSHYQPPSGPPPSHYQAPSGPPPQQYQAPSGPPPQQYQTKPQYQQQQAPASSGQPLSTNRILIWHAPSGNALLTATDEKTPVYNMIDSRSPKPSGQPTLNGQPVNPSGMQRQNPTGATGDYTMTQQQQPQQSQQRVKRIVAEKWTQYFRRQAEHETPPIGEIRRNVDTSLDYNVVVNHKIYHMKVHNIRNKTDVLYDEKEIFSWKGSHGIYTCVDTHKNTLARAEGQNGKHDGFILLEDRAISEGLMDLLVLTAYALVSIEDEKNEPVYGAYATPMYGPFGGYGYGMGYGGMGFGGMGLYPFLL